MKIQGILTEVKPLGQPMGQHGARYSFAKLRSADGREADIMFINQDFTALVNQPVVIEDVSGRDDKIQWEASKSRYKIKGTGVSVTCNGQEYGNLGSSGGGAPAGGPPPGQAAPAGGPPPGASAAPTSTARAGGGREGSMNDLVDYGLRAVNYARHCGEQDSAILASVFGAAMYGFKEGRVMEGKDTWQARTTFDATSAPPQAAATPPPDQGGVLSDDEEEDIPF